MLSPVNPIRGFANHRVAPGFQAISLLLPEIRELLEQKNYALLRQLLKECDPIDLAEIWNQFDAMARITLFRLLGTTAAVKLFESLEVDQQQFLLTSLSDETVSPVLDEMSTHGLSRLFHRLPPRVVKKMSRLLKREEALQKIEPTMKFKEGTAGALMHSEFVKLSPKMTAKQALHRLQAVARPRQKDYLYGLFSTDDEGKVLGGLSLQDLVGAPEDAKLSEIMTGIEPIKVSPETDQEGLGRLFAKYALFSAPVVDDQDHLIGVLTVDDIIDIVRAEATEDITKMAGTRPEELLGRSTWRIARLRLPWLVLTLGGELLVSLVIRTYEFTLSRVIALAAFMPLTAAMGGNVGSQSATIMVRSIALGSVGPHNRVKFVVKELGVGAVLGLAYGLVLGVAAYILYGSRFGFSFSLVVGLGLLFSMCIASFMGAVEPLLFKRLGIDPATATGPLITTTTDLLSTSAYFLLATLLLGHFLH